MLKYDPWATVARVEVEERMEKAARARQRREAREQSVGTVETAGRPSRLVVLRSVASQAWLWLRHWSVRRLDSSSQPKVGGGAHFWTKQRPLPTAAPEE